MGAHKLGSIQQGIVFVCVKVSEPSVFYIFKNETKSQIHFCCTFQIVQKMIKFLVHECFVERFHSSIEYFVSRSFMFRIHQQILTVNATLLSSCDPQHLPRYVRHPHLLFLIRFALRVECFYVDVKRKILETIESHVYT